MQSSSLEQWKLWINYYFTYFYVKKNLKHCYSPLPYMILTILIWIAFISKIINPRKIILIIKKTYNINDVA